jgi:hypothetical protein
MFIKQYASEFRSMLLSVLGIALVAFTTIVGLVLAVPHLPLANKRTFYALLRAQLAVDEGEKMSADPQSATQRGMVLFLGSSVVERGVSERTMDSVFARSKVPFETMNAGTGGFSAEANLPMFRAMLDDGLRPACIVYGVGIQELNGLSNVHAFLGSSDTSAVKLKPKTLWNMMRYGPTALAPLLNADHLHQYLFAANNAFRDVPNLTLFDRLMFGQNMPPQDSAYHLEQKYLDDLKEIVSICKSRGIKIAIYNAPLRPRTEAERDVPYLHRADSYGAVLALARESHIPIWNFDHKGLFDSSEFQDNYHLTPAGARKISGMLADSIARWRGGVVSQDGMETLSN